MGNPLAFWLTLSLFGAIIWLWILIRRGRIKLHRAQNAERSNFLVKNIPLTNIRVAILAEDIGQSDGDRCSQQAVTTIWRRLRTYRGGSIARLLEQAMTDANGVIRGQARGDAQKPRGASVIIAVLAAQRLYLTYLGSCKAFLVRQNAVFPLTVSHTVAQERVWTGEINQAGIYRHPERHTVRRWLGESDWIFPGDLADAKRTYELDTSDKLGKWPSDGVLPLAPNDHILLATSQVADGMSLTEIASVLRRRGPRAGFGTLVDRSTYGRVSLNALLLPFRPGLGYGLARGAQFVLLMAGIYVGGFLTLNYFCSEQAGICTQFQEVAAQAGIQTRYVRASTAAAIAQATQTADANATATTEATVFAPQETAIVLATEPTATEVPSATPTLLPTSSATPAPTETTTPIPPPVEPTATNTPEVADVREISGDGLIPPVISLPVDGQTAIPGQLITFQWQWPGQLQDTWGFEIVHSANGSLQALYDASLTNRTANAVGGYVTEFPFPNGLNYPEIEWCVRVVVLDTPQTEYFSRNDNCSTLRKLKIDGGSSAPPQQGSTRDTGE